MTDMKALGEAVDACFKDCSDYSCVRMGSCTGCAGRAYSEALRASEKAPGELL